MENWHYEIHQIYNDTYDVINPWEDKIFIKFNWDNMGEKDIRKLSSYEKFLNFLKETQSINDYKLSKTTINYIDN